MTKFQYSPTVRRIRYVLPYILLVILVAFWVYVWQTHEAPQSPEQVSFKVEIADSESERMQGLSGRTEVPDNYGMLFVFPQEGRHGFWMKDMNVAIDIIWIRKDGSIASIKDSVSPDTYPEIFSPDEPVPYVLETRAGYARDHGWNVGTVVPIHFPK